MPDKRVNRSKETVLRATLELLNESGLGGLSVDAVARRSGVAKTTIYRHWPSRADLVAEACSQISSEEREIPDTGTLRGDLQALLRNLAHLLDTARWSSVLPSIVDAAERDPELAAVHGRIQWGHAAPFRVAIERAIMRGELPKQSDPSVLTAALVGPLFFRRWFSREPLDQDFQAGLLALVLQS